MLLVVLIRIEMHHRDRGGRHANYSRPSAILIRPGRHEFT